MPPLGNLQALEELDLGKCVSLSALPDGVLDLPELTVLNLEGCVLLPLDVRTTCALPHGRAMREAFRKRDR